MTVTHATDALTEAFDIAVEELGGFLARITADRTIRVDLTQDGRYIAVIDDGKILFPPTPNLDTVIRFIRAFAAKEGVRVDEDSIEYARCERAGMGFSVKVAETLAGVLPEPPVPSNVVPIREGANA